VSGSHTTLKLSKNASLKKEKHVNELSKDPLLKFTYQGNQMFEQNSLRDSDISPRDAGEKGQTYILVKPGEAPSTKRTERMVVEEPP